MAAVKNIICPTDFSDLSCDSIPWVKQFADEMDANIHCIYVLQEVNYIYPAETGAALAPNMDELEESYKQQLEFFVAENFGDEADQIGQAVRRGRPSDEIVDFSKTKDDALIVMPTHGYSGLKHIVMGSTTEAVLRQASCPVVAIPSK